MVTPFWLRGGEESALWTSRTSIDTALAGDPWASAWSFYESGGTRSYQFDLSRANAGVRTLQDCCRLGGQECLDGPVGLVQTHPIPNTVGEVTAITTSEGAQYSRHSHLLLFNIDSLYGRVIAWPSCIATGTQPTPDEEIVGLVGHLVLLGEEITADQCEWMTPRVCPTADPIG